LERHYARATIRRLTAEQLLDAQSHVLAIPAKFQGYPEGTRAGEIAGVQRVRPREKPPLEGDLFLRLFGKPDRLLSCECERSNEPILGHALSLIGSDGLQARIQRSGNRLDQLLNAEMNDVERIEELFWTALGRAPTEQERHKFANPLASASEHERRTILEDIVWALLNSKEMVFRN